MRAHVAGMLLGLALPLEAVGSAVVEVPLPREKPVSGDRQLAQAEAAPPMPEPRPDRQGFPAADGGPPLPEERPATASDVPLPEERPAGAAAVPLPVDKPTAVEPGPDTDTNATNDAGRASDPSAGDSAAGAGDPAGPPLPHEPPDHTAIDDTPSQPPGFDEAGEGLSPACPAIEEARVSGRPLPPVRDDGACPVAAIYAISFVGSGRSVRLEPEAVVNCAMAERLDEYVEKVLEPAASDILGGALATLRVAGSYVCRNRNGQPDAPPSEHGLANAIDISAFVLEDGRIVSVSTDWSGEGPEGAFLRHVHGAACGPFTTVLGPEADSFHQDHLHFDLQRRGTDGRTTFCQ